MTQNKDDLHIDDALNKLYGNGIKDLTSDGYVDSLSQLRKINVAEARQVERVLDEPLKQRVFPRRKREWYQTSEGTRARLVLLPSNPHIQLDIRIVRDILGISADHFKAGENSPLWKEISSRVKPESVRKIFEGNVVGQWITLHRQAANHCIDDDMGDLLTHLSLEQRTSAINTSKIDLQADSVPDWLKRSPDGSTPHVNTKVPLDWIAGRLVKRHHLPWQAASPLAFYILTENPDWVTNIEPMNVEVSHDDNRLEDPDAFSITVKEIDEFVRKADWAQIWDEYISPRQQKMWEKRGRKPQGRRTVDIDRLKDNISLYSQMVLKNKSLAKFLKKSLSEELFYGDQETIRRMLNDFDDLLNPNKT